MNTSVAVLVASALALGASSAFAESKVSTVAALHKDKAALSGKEVRLQGKVVKVNNGIMGRNFVHVQDGSGDQETNDMTVTTKQTANVGDKVMVTGRLIVNRDFGAGYAYPVLVEEASLAPGK